MRTRILGKSGFRVSEIGIGCWQLGGDFGPMEDERALATLAAAQDAGVNFFDTADVYGGGRSEKFLARHFASGVERATRGDCIIATKVGRSSDLYPNNYRFDDIRDHLLASADRLAVETLDLVQLHCVPPAVLQDGAIFDTMDRLQADGLCRAWGASVETIDEAKICLAQKGLTSLQIIFNLFRQDPAWDLLPEAAEKNVGVIVRLPLASGLLTGKFVSGQIFAESDHRSYNRDGEMFSVGETFSGIAFEKGVELADDLKGFVPEGYTLAEMALRWLLDQEGVSTIIAGCSHPEQVKRNAFASSLPPLPEGLRGALRTFYEGNVREFIRCPI